MFAGQCQRLPSCWQGRWTTSGVRASGRADRRPANHAYRGTRGVGRDRSRCFVPRLCPRSGTIRNHLGFGRTRPGCCSLHGRHRGRQPLRAGLRSRHQRGVAPSHHRGRPDHQRITHCRCARPRLDRSITNLVRTTTGKREYRPVPSRGQNIPVARMSGSLIRCHPVRRFRAARRESPHRSRSEVHLSPQPLPRGSTHNSVDSMCYPND